MRLYCLAALLAAACLVTPLDKAVAAPTESSRYQLLIDRYRQALDLDRDNLTLRYHLGVALLVDQRPDEAVAQLSAAYPAFADSPEANFNLGLAYSRIDDPDSALLYFEQAEQLGALEAPELFPLANAYYNLGLSYMQKGLGAEAERLFHKVLELAPQRLEVYHSLGELYSAADQDGRAAEAYSAYLEAFPDDRAVRDFLFAVSYNRGIELLNRQDHPGARSAFERAANHSPRHPAVNYYLAYLEYLEGKPDIALERLTELFPASDPALNENVRITIYNCAVALFRQKDPDALDRAREATMLLLEQPEPKVEELFLAGNIELARQRPNEARLFFLRILDLQPDHRGALTNLAVARQGAFTGLMDEGAQLMADARYREAIEALETAVGLDPSQPRARGMLSQARRALEQQTEKLILQAQEAAAEGEYVRALAEVRQALASRPESPRARELEAGLLEKIAERVASQLDEADSLAENQLWQAAAESFREVLELDPDNQRALTGMRRVVEARSARAAETAEAGSKALEEERLAEARELFTRALKLDESLVAAASGLELTRKAIEAAVHRKRQMAARARGTGDYDEAGRLLKEALAIAPEQQLQDELNNLEKEREQRIGSMLEEGYAALEKDELKQGETLFRRILALAPDHAGAQQGLDRTTTEQKRVAERKLADAAEALEKQRFDQAVKLFRAVLDQEPANPSALKGLERSRAALQTRLLHFAEEGHGALERGDFAAAETAFRAALQLDPYYPEAKSGLERLARTRQSGLKPGDEQRIYLQGVQFYTAGRYQEAVAAWQKVLLLDPDHQRARLNIDKCRRKLKLLEERRQ